MREFWRPSTEITPKLQLPCQPDFKGSNLPGLDPAIKERFTRPKERLIAPEVALAAVVTTMMMRGVPPDYQAVVFVAAAAWDRSNSVFWRCGRGVIDASF